jgi:antitoxin PrlF
LHPILDLSDKLKSSVITAITSSTNLTAKSEKQLVACRSDDCCRVESIVGVDEHGHMVLPKDIRERAEILMRDKPAVVSMEKDGKICSLSLIKVYKLEGTAKSVLGPVTAKF